MPEPSHPPDPADAPNRAPEELFEELYDELRRLARARMARIPPGQTLQPTALVHEVWLRLSKATQVPWNSRAHFFGAAALAMRRILVEQARRKRRVRHGGGQKRLDVDEIELAIEVPVEDILAVDQVLARLEDEHPRQAQVVLLRWFAGLEREEVAELMGVSLRTVDREWRSAAARMKSELESGAPTKGP